MIHEVTLDDGTVVVSDEGPRDGTTPLLLLHGFTGSHASWGELRAGLPPERRTLAVDLPGHGGTRLGGVQSVPTIARLLDQLLDRLGIERAIVAGYSMGGRIALALALEHPARVAALVLESASAGIRDEAEREARRAADAALAQDLESHGLAAFVERWEDLPLFATVSAELRARLRAVRLAQYPAELARSLREAGTGAQPWYGDRLSELRRPTLVLAGALDAKFAAIARSLARAVAGAELAIVEGSGHVVHAERPREHRQLLARFLHSLPEPNRPEEVHPCSTGRRSTTTATSASRRPKASAR